MSPTRAAPELLSSLTTGWNDAMQQWWNQAQAAFDPWRQAWDTMTPGVPGRTPGMPSGRHHTHQSSSQCGCDSDGNCGCGGSLRHEHGHEHEHVHDHSNASCGCGNVCRCCVPDADVVLHARAGEQRVIPFLLHNPWRREREVTIAVGPWRVCNAGRLEVRSVVDAEESLTLQPCEKRVVRLLVLVRGTCDETQDPKNDTVVDQEAGTKGGKPSTGKTAGATSADNTAGADAARLLSTAEGKRFGCDVESCTSAYADVRFEGCARPQRVAVVVHPASCDAVELPCDCDCCG
jgi:hypothetical protein